MGTRAKLSASVLGLLGLAGFSVLVGCSSSSTTLSTSSPLTASTAPMVVTVSDAPLSNILSAVVTLSNASLTSGSTSAPVITQPVTVELSSLGAIQEPIELTNVAFGSYNSVTLTVASAIVTYVNGTGQVITTTATLTQPTITVPLSPALSVSSQGEVQLQLAFNLAQSFSISGSAVTFGPAINTAGAQVSGESSGDRQIEVTGQVVSVSASSITVQSGDSGKQFAFTLNSSTQFPTGITANSIQTGAIVQIQGQTQTDGSLLAMMVTLESNGSGSGQQEDGAKGIIVSVTQNSSGVLTGFTMVPRENYGTQNGSASSLSVTVSSATTYGVPEDALQAGVSANAFTVAEVFPGQSVVVAGAASTGGILAAQQVTLAAESIAGALAATPQGTSPNFTFSLTLPTSSLLTTYDNFTSLNVATNQTTEFGNSLTASSFAALTAGTSVETHGYLIQDSPGNFLLYASSISQVETPESPEGNNQSGDN